MPGYFNGMNTGYPKPMEYPMIYVNGIEGANAYQMPFGVTKQILWDAELDSFYVKVVDEMGRPKVIAWKDFVDHVVPEQPATKTEASGVDMSQYLTKSDLDKILEELTIGEHGRIVRKS